MLKNLIEHIRIFVKRKKNALKFAHKFPTSETTLKNDFSQDAEKNSHLHLPGHVIFVRQFCGQVRFCRRLIYLSLSLSVEC